MTRSPNHAHMPRQQRPAKAWLRRIAPVAITATVAALILSVGSSPVAAADEKRSSGAKPATVPQLHKVTLVTGDVVEVRRSADGRESVTLDPGPDGVVPQAAINRSKGHLYVVPRSAISLLAAQRLDLRLFDVDRLIADGYDDRSRSTLPVIVDFGKGALASSRARSTQLIGAERTRTLPLLGDAVYDTSKQRAREFWSHVTASSTSSPAGHLLHGVQHIWLDGRVHALDVSAPLQQTHVPAAWDAGFDGSGVKVAVLDTGYDPGHPDLAGRVIGSADFTPEPGVVDHNGHGTHVASTIAGTGAASAGLYRGVAPGASLLIGKVLDGSGTGEDSQVMAGMSWAVGQHAAIVSMSLGGDPGDGSSPLERAVDELSSTSTTLFVIAAGNSGPTPGTITSPGAAASALTVGAVDGTDSMADFSSRGPLINGEIKPNIVAPGVNIVAARAAGTSLGDPVDDNYTTLSGTSMATPHVAGIAAILKQEHPKWSGALIKSAVTSSAVSLDGVTASDTGVGRVDAGRAIDQTVLTQPSLDLGYFSWPHSSLAPRSIPLTYTNRGDSDVTLSLDVTSEDGSSAVPGVGLSADHITVPADGQATVNVTVDPTVETDGAYAGVVTGTSAAADHQTVRTAVGYYLEPERYTLKVVIKPRAGTQVASHVLSLLGFSDYSYDQRELDSAKGQRTVSFRLPPGMYSTTLTSFGQAADDSSEGVLDVRPQVELTQDTTLTIDESTSKLFDYVTDRPVVNDGAVMYSNWLGPKGDSTGGAIYGKFDRLYSRPMKDEGGGTVNSQVYFQLSQPEAQLNPVGTAPVGLRPVPSSGGSIWLTTVPRLSGSFPVVAAGSTRALKVAHAKGAVAVVSVSAGACPDLAATARSLRRAGAVALVAYPGHGQVCSGSLKGTAALPTFQTRPVDAHRLLTHRHGKAAAVTRSQSSYVYDLAAGWPDVPAGARVDAHNTHVAAMVEHVDALTASSTKGLGVYDHFVGWLPGLGSATFGLVRRVALPSTVTHYVSSAPTWERDFDILDDKYLGSYASLFAPPKAVTAGKTYNDTWLGGPVGDRASALMSKAYGNEALPTRQGDEFYAGMAPLTDSAGHVGTALFGETQTARLYADGALVLDAFDPLQLNGFPVDPGKTHYDLEFSLSRHNVAWRRSTTVHTTWGFDSATPTGSYDVLPLLDARFVMGLSNKNQAPQGVRWTFGVRAAMPPGVKSTTVSTPRVDISWDAGKTWSRLPVTACKHYASSTTGGTAAECTVSVTNHTSGTASLRVRAADAAGRSVDQTILAAYTVH